MEQQERASRRAARRAWSRPRARPAPAGTAAAARRSATPAPPCPPSPSPRAGSRSTTRATGSRTSSTRTAAARTEPVARGLPISTPTSASVAITPARITDGSAPVITTKKTTVPTARPNRGHRVSRSSEASPRIGASTIATFSPETTSRWPRPLAWKSRIIPGSSREASPSASPSSSPASFAGKSRAIDRPTNARNTCAARTNGLGDGPRRSTPVRVQLDDHALVRERIPEPGVVGAADRALGGDHVAAHPRRRVVVGAQPQRRAQGRGRAGPLDTRDVERGVPSERAGLGVGVERADDRDALRREPGEQRVLEPRGVDTGPAGAEQRPDRSCASAIAATGDPPTPRGALTTSTAAGPGSASPVVASGSDAGGGARRGQPRPDEPGEADHDAHPRPDPRRADLPCEQPRPERRGGRRQRPRVHTVANGRICSSVDGPMPVTSIRSSTVANGPFCVR